jgi:predicted nucleotidyltransferase
VEFAGVPYGLLAAAATPLMVYNFKTAAVFQSRAAHLLHRCFPYGAMREIAPILNAKLDDVIEMCRQHHVARMELFGSAAKGEFDSVRSDLDFLVEFEALGPVERADAYFGLLAGLQDLFERDVDLVEAGAVNNPFFRRSIEETRTVLYAA